MAQHIDIRHLEKVESQPINQRFVDITGAAILQGFRVEKGNGNFTLSITRGTFNSSIAIAPNGARIEETTDLIDNLNVGQNGSSDFRIDSVYLKYQHGHKDAVATYEVVQGTTVPIENPNPLTHLLLAYVTVPPMNGILYPTSIETVPYGFKSLNVAGPTEFSGPVTFNKDVLFRGNVVGGTFTGEDGDPTMIKRLAQPVIATHGQTEITLPEPYVMNTHSLFVYRNGEIVAPTEYVETTNLTFRFIRPLRRNEQVWAYWYSGLNIFYNPVHDHDDLYYRKTEIANRAVRTKTGTFNGSVGRVVTHNLNTDNYVVIAVVPTSKTTTIGQISVEKRLNQIIVYNDGSYRGKFDISYMLDAPFLEMQDHESYSDFAIESSFYNATVGLYEQVIHRRPTNGSVYLKSVLGVPNERGFFTRLRLDYYNEDGTQITQTKTWGLTYDEFGKISAKTRIS